MHTDFVQVASWTIVMVQIVSHSKQRMLLGLEAIFGRHARSVQHGYDMFWPVCTE